MRDFLQHQAPGTKSCSLRLEGRNTCRDQIGIDKHRAVSLVGQKLASKRRLAGAVGAGDDDDFLLVCHAVTKKVGAGGTAGSWQPGGEEVADADDLARGALAIGEALPRGAQGRLVANIVDAAELVAGATGAAGAGCATADVVDLLVVVELGLLSGIAITESVGFDAAALLIDRVRGRAQWRARCAGSVAHHGV